ELRSEGASLHMSSPFARARRGSGPRRSSRGRRGRADYRDIRATSPDGTICAMIVASEERHGSTTDGGAPARERPGPRPLPRRLGPRVTHLCLVSPGGFPSRRFGDRPIRSYKEAGGDERLFREICRHNLLVNMLSDSAGVTEEAIDIQADGVRRTRFDSRKV